MKSRNKICCVFNYPSHYRFPIYKEMDEQFNCDFYFGNSVFMSLKKFDPRLLSGFRDYLCTKQLFSSHVKFYKDVKKVLKTDYTHYIITGEPYNISNWLILFYARLHHKSVLLWTHGISGKPFNFIKKYLYVVFYGNCTGLLLYNNRNIKFMEKIGCKKSNIHVIHNSLDTNLQSEIYTRCKESTILTEHFRNDNPNIIYIGRIQKIKRIDFLITSLGLLKRNGYEVNLTIVGDYADNDLGIDQLIVKENLQGNVWLYGPSYNEETNALLLYNAMACVSPGNVGLTCIHSLSYGTPIITNDNLNYQMPEFEAIKEGITGSFFIDGNVEDLAKHIKFWTSRTPEERKITREVARHTIVQEWSIDYQIKVLKEVLA